MDVINLIDELDEIVYVSSLDTYELLYINEIGKKAMGLNDISHLKCYKALQGKDSPCEFCTNSILKEDEYYIWENTNTRTNRHFILKDKLIKWEGKHARLEIALDITEKEDISKSIAEKLEIKELLVGCIKHLITESNFSDAVNLVLTNIGKFHKADRAYVFEVSEDRTKVTNTYEWCNEGVDEQKQALTNLDINELKNWFLLFEQKGFVIIDDIENIKEEQPIEYEILKPQKIESLMTSSLKQDDKVVGFIGVDNPHKAVGDTSLLTSLSYFLLTEMKKRKVENKLNYMSYYDFLTGAYNRNKYIKYIDNFQKGKVKSIGVVFVDINGLKDINDNFGHANGDSAIVSACVIIKKYFHSYNVYRIGGDEFVVLCEDISKQLFEELVSWLSEEFKDEMIYSVAVGSIWSDDNIDIHKLIKVADERMYQDKKRYYNKNKLRNNEMKVISDLADSTNNILFKHKELVDKVYFDDLMIKGYSKAYEKLAYNTYDIILSICIDTNLITPIYQSESNIFSFPIKENLEKTFSYIKKHLIHHDDIILFNDNHLLKSLDSLNNSKQDDLELNFEYRRLGIDKKYYWALIYMLKISSKNKLGEKQTHILVAIKNIDYLMQLHKNQKDTLTGLYNYESFCEQISLMLKRYPDKRYAIIMMDIDKFKVINDIYGVRGGDKALIYVAELIQKNIGSNGICCRMYADVFCIFYESYSDRDIHKVIYNIKNSLNRKKFEYMLVPCFGVYRILDNHIPITNACEMAGYAHKKVKKQSINNYIFYDDTIRNDALEEKQMEREMEYALENGQFHVYLQPKYNLNANKIVGAEALVRWVHPEKGIIPPIKFISLFEKNGFIIRLDMYVWEQVCSLIRKWIDLGEEPVPISVNVSRLHLHNPHFKEIVLSLINKYSIPKSFLELELTESLFIKNIKLFTKIIADLRMDGIVLNMDDFGSAYSSLNMLKNINIDTLKIDCGFFNEEGITDREKIVLKHTIAMAKDLDMDVVAEGVETKEQAEFLVSLDCVVIQGYYYCKPIPSADFEKLLYQK
ncbi:TPA: bifunctional diguanylate cyclase/phosphodiesterase [Clostridioides difficile]|nr:bifunctional diguanylate cyclase/phosphodiesterase [Clostridioides difficile]HBG4539116.1 bifunctional diguanylate cyclase/phosphodiesterase [Clostridioides difficile]HBG4669092.1 bifunctional diguanylate cyclase/phosphodiesterase [Clostridioides difficile]HBG5287856.1 bifunctional diguanylate cyclase/phosphodiesterase [Clostridioides difficile]HBG5562208.1 bifunctional diguanylate cyclase/phosphodiesterase [Clostridioides difficile]